MFKCTLLNRVKARGEGEPYQRAISTLVAQEYKKYAACLGSANIEVNVHIYNI